MMGTATIDLILGKLDKVQRSGNGWVACCPAHEDRNPSLSVAHRDGRILLNCQTGCATEDVARALGVCMTDLFDEPLDSTAAPTIASTYDYTDAEGKLLYQVARMIPKNFKQRRPDGEGGWIWNMEGQERVLYRLPKVKSAIAAGVPVFVVEGEKDVHTLEAWGLTATTNPGGATKWLPSYSEDLRGARVIVLPDNDDRGKQHAALVAESLLGVAGKCITIELPGLDNKGDVTDWARSGKTKEDLVKAIKDRPGRIQSVVDGLEWVKDHTRRDNPLPKGIAYPWMKVNQMTNGMHPGWLCILAGYTSHGKTAAAIEVAVEACKDSYKVLFVSLEMPIESISVRVAQRFGLNSFHFYQGRSNDEDRDAVDRACKSEKLKNLMVVADARTVQSIGDAIAEANPDLVIVDYLGKMEMPGSDIRVAIGKNTQGLSDLAKSAKVPILCLAQLRRNVASEAGSVPTEQDLKESSNIEQEADQVIFVWRERDKQTKIAKEQGLFIVAKSRMGMIGTEGFHFDGKRQMFYPIAQQMEGR